jgi:hypothetical protein
MILSPGQLRLRELVADAASHIDPQDDWRRDPPTFERLSALRTRILSDRLVIDDGRTGQELATPSVPATYVEMQELLFPCTRASEATVVAEHLLFHKPQLSDPPIAAAGGVKWFTTYGALTHLAHGRALQIGDESAPTIFSGSSVVSIGAGSNHRTLASYLWGNATLEHHRGRIKVIDDELDSPLWRACERLETACPRSTRRFGLTLDYDYERDNANDLRERIIALAEEAEHDEGFSRALLLRSQRRRPRRSVGTGFVPLHELEALTSAKRGPLTQLWQKVQLATHNRREQPDGGYHRTAVVASQPRATHGMRGKSQSPR